MVRRRVAVKELVGICQDMGRNAKEAHHGDEICPAKLAFETHVTLRLRHRCLGA